MKKLLLPVLLSSTPLLGQSQFPQLTVTESVSTTLGDPLVWTITGVPGQAYAILLDTVGGPVDLLGERFWLGASPNLLSIFSGGIPPQGDQGAQISTLGTTLVGAFYLQAVTLDPTAPNGIFRVSNPESSIFHATPAAIVDRFDDADGEGFVGNFDADVLGRLQGGAVQTRTQRTVDLSTGITFPQGISTPLNHFGSRAQVVFRPEDLGSTGECELVTAIRWRAFGGAVSNDNFTQIAIDLAHSDVVPDYTIGAFTALPVNPASGLDPIFSQNPASTPVNVYTGPYALQASDLNADGYVDYPAPTSLFEYDGARSLLVDFKTSPSTVPGPGLNGQVVRLMVLSSPDPAARSIANGQPGQLLDPFTAQLGQGDNALYDYQIDFTRVKTTATSPWRLGQTGADYQAPIVASHTPPGTSVGLEFRGADDEFGANATPWSSSVDVADGRTYVQYRVTLTGDLATGEVPAVDTIVIPF